MGRLAAWEKRKVSEEYEIQSCEVYTDRQGRKRFKGTSYLRKTEKLFCKLKIWTVLAPLLLKLFPTHSSKLWIFTWVPPRKR